MSLDIHVSMNEEALAPFRSAWETASVDAISERDPRLLQSARQHHQQIAAGDVAPFLHGHLTAIDEVIRFLEDTRWEAEAATRRALHGALNYFVDPSDLIPDEQSQFGLLDDAIVLELALTEHSHEWSAWREFDRFRRDYPQFADLDRPGWMQLRQDELRQALRHRRRTGPGLRAGYSSVSPLAPFQVH